MNSNDLNGISLSTSDHSYNPGPQEQRMRMTRGQYEQWAELKHLWFNNINYNMLTDCECITLLLWHNLQSVLKRKIFKYHRLFWIGPQLQSRTRRTTDNNNSRTAGTAQDKTDSGLEEPWINKSSYMDWHSSISMVSSQLRTSKIKGTFMTTHHPTPLNQNFVQKCPEFDEKITFFLEEGQATGVHRAPHQREWAYMLAEGKAICSNWVPCCL